MRPISNVVDITNYVMLAIGEPTHAFDLDKVAGREIIVRRATRRRAGDDPRRPGIARSTPTSLVIADAEKPSAIAGLMGAEWSEVTDETTTVLMECANFDGPSTQRSSIRLGLRTEGSSRWEKGLDPHLPPQALRARVAADGRAHRREARPGHDRRARRAARAAGGRAAAGAARGA